MSKFEVITDHGRHTTSHTALDLDRAGVLHATYWPPCPCSIATNPPPSDPTGTKQPQSPVTSTSTSTIWKMPSLRSSPKLYIHHRQPRCRFAARGLQKMHHKTLSAYYPRLCTLEEYLSAYEGLVYHSDPDEYRSLVSGALCAERHHKLGIFPPPGTVEGSQQDAIDGLLRALGHDVLVLGNRVSGADQLGNPQRRADTTGQRLE